MPQAKQEQCLAFFSHECHNVGKENHFKKLCRSAKSNAASRQVNQLHTETDSDIDDSSDDTFTIDGLSLNDDSGKNICSQEKEGHSL